MPPSADPRTAPGAALIDRPIARCVLDLAPPHLDRPFDYVVPDGMSARAVPGVRVVVRFGGRDVPGYLTERIAASDHAGRLIPLSRVVSAEPVLTQPVLTLCRAVADRYAGSLSDVLRLAVPPRHAATEAEQSPIAGHRSTEPSTHSTPSAWAEYRGGPALLARLAAGEAPRAVWAALPGLDHVTTAIAEAVGTVAAQGRGAIVVLPDRRDVDALDAQLTTQLGPGRHVRLEADLGPAARYRAFLACLRGQSHVAIGTRSAAFAPIRDPALVVIWDDGDPTMAEPRAPYPHAVEVLRIRADLQQCAAVIGGWSVSTEAAALLQNGWAREVSAPRETRRQAWADVRVADPHNDTLHARFSTAAWRAVSDAVTERPSTRPDAAARGPVLIQVPRAGYVPAAACARCRRPARCRHCAGPIEVTAADTADTGDALTRRRCGWCGRGQHGWACPHCGGTELRAVRIGVERTADELGRAFPGVPVVLSRPERRLPAVGERAAVIVATPGVEPPPGPHGYAAGVLLDGDVLLAQPDLRAGEHALRRWSSAVALVRGRAVGGRVVLSADATAPATQALVRADPVGFAERELLERAELRLPPAVRMVSVTGPSHAVATLSADIVRRAIDLGADPAAIDILGPIPVPETGRTPPAAEPPEEPEALLPEHDPFIRNVLRCSLRDAEHLLRSVRTAVVARSAHRDSAPVRVHVDPRDLG